MTGALPGYTPGPPALKGCQGPPGCEGPAGLSLSPEAYEECLAALRQGRIEDDERRANVWWRRLGRKLRSMWDRPEREHIMAETTHDHL